MANSTYVHLGGEHQLPHLEYRLPGRDRLLQHESVRKAVEKGPAKAPLEQHRNRRKATLRGHEGHLAQLHFLLGAAGRIRTAEAGQQLGHRAEEQEAHVVVGADGHASVFGYARLLRMAGKERVLPRVVRGEADGQRILLFLQHAEDHRAVSARGRIGRRDFRR